MSSFTHPGWCLRAVAGLLLAMVTSAASAGATELPLQARHEPSGLNSRFSFEGGPFEAYVAHSRQIITRARVDAPGSAASAAIDANSPFELKPAASCPPGQTRAHRRGVVISHGLSDSPYFMRALARVLQQRCFHVMAVLLPGHGTRPGDLLEVTWAEWARALAYGVDTMAPEVDEVYLAGFSTGGTLAIHQALQDERVRGLFLFAPALKVSPLAIMANWHKAIDWLAPRTRWLDIRPDEDPTKYESFAANAADQIHLLSTQVRGELARRPLSTPMFVAASEDDATVETAATLAFFERSVHPASRMLLYSHRSGALPPRVERVPSALPAQRILSSAHTAIVVPPEDPHYGRDGDYASCAHYFESQPGAYRRCQARREDHLGEITRANLARGVVRRLSFNPQFPAMQAALLRFIESLP